MIIGLENLEKKLKKIARIKIERIMKDVGEKVRGEARILVPVDSGELQDSIFMRIENAKKDKVQAIVFTSKEYAPYVEFGTGPKGEANHQGISPEVNPMYSPTGWSYYDDKLEKWIYTTGQEAQPFMYPALHNNRAKIKKFIAHRIKKDIKELKK